MLKEKAKVRGRISFETYVIYLILGKYFELQCVAT